MNFGGVGTQTVRVTDATFLNDATLFDEVTISFWQKLTATGQSSSFWASAPSLGSDQRGIQTHAPWSDGNIYFDHSGCCDSAQRIAKSAAGINFAQWRHFAYVKKGGTKEIWIDGALFHSGTGAVRLPGDFTRLFIGSKNDPLDSIQGVMDDFAIFSRGLTPSQIGLLAAGLTPEDIMAMSRDSDGDGMNDFWEGQYGLNPNDPSDASGDLNGNGISNLFAYVYGLVPTAPGPAPEVDADVPAGTLNAAGTPRTNVENIPNGVNYCLVYTRRIDAASSGLNPVVEFSSALATWFPNAGGETILASNGVVELVKVTYPFFLPDGRKARFWRLVLN